MRFPRSAAARTCRLALALGISAAAVTAQDFESVSFEVGGAPITGGRGLDDTGCVAGYSQSDVEDVFTAQAILRCDGAIETIDPPTAIGDSRAFDVSAAGLVVGSAQRPRGHHGWQYDGVAYGWVEFPGADKTVLRGVNEAGDVVGEYVDLLGTRHGFTRIDGRFTTVDLPMASETRLRGINDLGDVVGVWLDDNGLRWGFVRDAVGDLTWFDFGPSLESTVGDINNSGWMAGTLFESDGTPTGMVLSPFPWMLTYVRFPGAVGTIATGINESGQVTGEWIDAVGTRRGFVATPFLFTDGFESKTTDQWSSVSE